MGESLNASHPLGTCGRGTVERPGCGHVILTTIKAEAEAVFNLRRRKVTTSRHRLHDPGHYVVPYCSRCEATPAAALLDSPGNDAGAALAPADALGRRP